MSAPMSLLQRTACRFRFTHNAAAAFGRRFAADRRGSMAVLAGLATILLIGFIGIGLDTARAYMVHSRLSTALDAAALAGGLAFFEADRDEEIKMIFRANFPDDYLGAKVGDPVITPDNENERLLLTASADVPTTLMRVFDHDSIKVDGISEISRRMIALDVVLSMDVSGSMGNSAPDGSGSRLDDAKQAAKDLLDILYGTDNSKDLLNVGLVPWSAKVNIGIEGETFDPALTTTHAVPSFTNPDTGMPQSRIFHVNNSPVPLLAPPPEDWAGCVFNRYLDDGTDDNDGDIRYATVEFGGVDIWPGWAPVVPGDDATPLVEAITGEPEEVEDVCKDIAKKKKRKKCYEENPLPPVKTLGEYWGGEPVSGGTCQITVSGNECAACPRVGITPLKSNKATMVDAINGLTDGGNTNIPAGLAWAWRVLKPGAPFEEAVLDPDYNRDQAIVLLTDGENCAIDGDGYNRVFGNCSGGRDDMNDRLRLLAQNIKSDGVIIYAIQFANDGSALQTLLQDVASGPEAPFYYYAPGSDDLKAAFKEIANHLSELRLSK